jgi:hypothetical protein
MDAIFIELERFYHILDKHTAALNQYHKDRLKCKKGCSACCVSGITVFSIEADYIKSKVEKNKIIYNDNASQCSYLDGQGACQIYEHRPYVCRTQGLPLRWVDNDIEYRDICPLNEEGEPITKLDPNTCINTLAFEQVLASLQIQYDQGKMERVLLSTILDN